MGPIGFFEPGVFESCRRIAVGFRFVVMIARLRGPIRMRLGVEGPIGNVKALDCIGRGELFEFIWCEPAGTIPIGGWHREPGFPSVFIGSRLSGRMTSLIDS